MSGTTELRVVNMDVSHMWFADTIFFAEILYSTSFFAEK